MKLSYDITELMPYISWPYFLFAWQVKEQAEKDRLQREANALLQQLAGHYHAYGLFELFDAYGDGDDIVLPSSAIRIPCLRQQKGNPPYLCLSDFITPSSSPPYLRTPVPPYLRTPVPPYLRTSVPPYPRTPVPPYLPEKYPSLLGETWSIRHLRRYRP